MHNFKKISKFKNHTQKNGGNSGKSNQRRSQRRQNDQRENMKTKVEENPSITIWVRDKNLDEYLSMTLLFRLKDERPDQKPQPIKDMLDKSVPYKRIRFLNKPGVAEGGTYVTCIFER